MGEDGEYGGRGCKHCHCMTYDQEWYKAFGEMICPQCKSQEALVSKGHAKEFFLLTDTDFRKLGSISKANPRHKDWTAMRLYLQSQVEAAACKKFGGTEGIEAHRRKQLAIKTEARAKKRALATNLESKEAEKLDRIRRRIESEALPLQRDPGDDSAEQDQQLAQGEVEEL